MGVAERARSWADDRETTATRPRFSISSLTADRTVRSSSAGVASPETMIFGLMELS